MTGDFPPAHQIALGSPIVMWTPLDPAAVERALSDEPTFYGTCADGRIQGTQRDRNKNSWRPYIDGTYSPAANGTLIRFTMRPNLFVLLFTFVHGIFFLGLTWLMGYGAFAWAVKQAREVFEATLMPEAYGDAALGMADGAVVSDPTSPGAEADAPYAFGFRSSMEGTTFKLEGAETSKVRLDGSGLTLRRRGATLRVDWADVIVVRLSHEGSEPSVEFVTTLGDKHLPLGGHTPKDQEWLVQYLESRNRRYSPTDEERERADAARARIGALRGNQKA